MALGKIWIYYCTDDSNRIVHTSYVLHSKFKFAFSKKNELEIGPCHTNKTFRNKGLYKNVVKRITSDEKFEGQSFFMIVEENNFPSIRGIESSGFKKFGCIKKTKFIKIYRIVDENS